MSHNEITVFLPCRAGSERVPHKNTRPFAGLEDGLLGIKLRQLEQVKSVHRVILDSNDEVVLEKALRKQKQWTGSCELIVQERPDELGTSQTMTDTLIKYALDFISDGHLMWTHVTSPFLDARIYEQAIASYKVCLLKGHDSLMSVNRLQTFLWDHNGPLNYARSPLRWPRTQDLKSVFEVNSGVFMVSAQVAQRLEDRIGEHPFLFELSHDQAFDIDWPADFDMAERLWIAQGDVHHE